MPQYKALRNSFTEEQYRKYARNYWALPALLGSAKVKWNLRRLREVGHDGVAAVLPLFGMLAGGLRSPWMAWSIEELARLCGINQKTVRHATTILGEAGYLETELRERYSMRVHHWRASPLLVQRGQGRAGGYFSFPIHLVYGGAWPMLPAPLRSVYLAAATLAFVLPAGGVESRPWREVLLDDVSDFDFVRASELGFARQRVARTTLKELGEISGVRPATIGRHLDEIKHPLVWATATAANVVEHRPFWVYPTRDRYGLLIHFRDHTPRWPFSLITGRDAHRLTEAELSARLPAEVAHTSARDVAPTGKSGRGTADVE